jgi:deoxyribodipyrimidine photo-lyase
MQIHARLKSVGSSILVRYGHPRQVWDELLTQYTIAEVYTNHDYEPYARQRDTEIATLLQEKGIALKTFKDQAIFDKDEVLKDNGLPYTVFTPYSRKWKKLLSPAHLKAFGSELHLEKMLQTEPLPVPSLADMNFQEQAKIFFPEKIMKETLLGQYGSQRDFPAIQGTSRLSVHLRFGTLSIREAAQEGLRHSEPWLNELIWRDFYMMILWHFPHVAQSAFKPAYDKIRWRNNEQEFAAWCEGRTGYSIVDAGMRELNETGFMHNRVRMITASFLTKHLLIDWRWGEAYFARKLLDFDLSANNGGWQWAAGSGCDAAPYFRVFNPSLQTAKFDPDFRYIRKWVPEFNQLSYPSPIVEHAFARNRALDTYKQGLGTGIE